MASSIVVTGIFCGSITLASAAFFILEFRRLHRGRIKKGGYVSRAQSIRRLVGAAGLIVIAAMFFWGANFLSPQGPLSFAIFWAIVGLGAGVIGFLGIMDMREVARHFRDSRCDTFDIDIPKLPRRGITSDKGKGASE